jgi:hypothetical protein
MSCHVYNLYTGFDPSLDFAFDEEPKLSADEPQLPQIDYVQLAAIVRATRELNRPVPCSIIHHSFRSVFDRTG